MYKAIVRALIRRSIRELNVGDAGPALAVFATDATLSFPGDNSWSHQFRPPVFGREQFVTHRGKDEVAAFLDAYVASGIQMTVEDVLVNGPPWNTRVAVRVNHGIPEGDGYRYTNRAVLFATIAWGKIRAQEDYEDTVRVAQYDDLTGQTPAR